MTSYSNSNQDLLRQGVLYTKKGQKGIARRHFRQLVSVDPNNETAWLYLVWLADNRHSAIEAVTRLKAINPANPNLPHIMAWIEATWPDNYSLPENGSPPPQTQTQNKTPSGDVLEERIRGSRASRVISEFVGTSALFPILEAIRSIALTGWMPYVTEPAHYALFAAAFIQAWVLGSVTSNRLGFRFLGNLIGFFLYAALDIAIDGYGFVTKSYHWLYGGFSLLIATLSVLQTATRHNATGHTITTILLNVGKLLLFPAMYLIVELNPDSIANLSLGLAWQQYMQSTAHQFIFFGALFFGILLGLAETQRANYANALQFMARQLKQYSEWSLSPDLIADAMDDPDALQLRRVERTILFMDIRGFTAWSEKVDPQQAVDMLNQFYSIAERTINHYGGHKPNFTADEIMTRFSSAETALATAQALQHDLAPILSPYNLATGIGLHTGEVIEGLLGSDNTRKYDIIGDAANTAKRLESSAGQGEIVMSGSTYRALPHPPQNVTARNLKVKGKANLLQAFVLSLQEGSSSK